MGLSEKDTRTGLIDPTLRAAHWYEELIEREYAYKRGRIRLLGEQTTRDEPQFVDYVLRDRPRGLILAVVEAKDEDHSPGDGLQQALAYATDLNVMFAYSSNGHGVVEHDRLTNRISTLEGFPSPDQLRDRLRAGRQMRGPTVRNKQGYEVVNPLIQPAFSPPSGGGMRYYQESAVTAAIDQVLIGRRRALLSLATGTGKTFIAFNVVWKLLESGYAKKVLFLADRVNLRDQAYNEFSAFGDARGVVAEGSVPLQRDIHFAIYQTLFAPAGTGRLFQQYPSDYFDVVIVDECHRSGYGDWGVILDHFSPAFHLGMTATPKRTDSIDTYEFFAGENRDDQDEPQPAYEYSLGQGIDDGFLATYRVHRINTNIDKHGLHIGAEIAKGAELIVPEGAQVEDAYAMAEFEKDIVIPDRTRLLCEHLASKLRTFGTNQKTIVFCVTMDHAEQVRNELQTILGPETGKQLYAARIVSEERDAKSLLEEFQLSTSNEPVVATTVDLLTTGVNVPAVRNIVFMKPIGSVSVFKQIIGRGSRVDDIVGKEFFRIIDYTNATRLFDDWDIPSPPSSGTQPTSGDGIIRGRVIDGETSSPIAGAAIAVRVGMREVAQVGADTAGAFLIEGLPEILVHVLAGATGYNRRQVKALPSERPDELTIELKQPSSKTGKISIAGVEVTIAEETELTLGDEDRSLTVSEYCDYAGEQIRTTAGDVTTLAELWRDPTKRRGLRKQLQSRRVDPAILAMLLRRPDADEYDLLAHVGFDARIRTREERARVLEHLDREFLARFTANQQAVVRALIDKYRTAGVEEIATARVFNLPPFIDDFGGIGALANIFGGVDQVREVMHAIQRHLYPEGQATHDAAGA